MWDVWVGESGSWRLSEIGGEGEVREVRIGKGRVEVEEMVRREVTRQRQRGERA